MTSQLSAHDYRTAGIATLSRQASFVMADYAFDGPTAGSLKKLALAAVHQADMSIKILEAICGYSILLVEQCAYPILLQVSHELDRLMETQIPNEKRQLALFKAIRPFLFVANPLEWVVMGNYIESFQAQIDCHQKVLDNYHDLWEYKTTTVTSVIDGDTIFVSDYDESIRIEGIDCPEIWHEGDEPGPYDSKWDAGNAAMDFTKSKLLGKEVELRARKKHDIYNRIIARVYLDGKDFANAIVAAGHGKFIFWTFL
jgi:hypothetical protein